MTYQAETNQAKTKRPVLVQKSSERAKFKPKPWSHQHDLNNLRGRAVRIETELGSFEGRLIEADQFAVKLDVSNDELEGPIDTVFFKHAIFSFTGL
jgi:hypothetical protein